MDKTAKKKKIAASGKEMILDFINYSFVVKLV